MTYLPFFITKIHISFARYDVTNIESYIYYMGALIPFLDRLSSILKYAGILTQPRKDPDALDPSGKTNAAPNEEILLCVTSSC